MDFEWDSAKAESNLKKHGVAFEYATRIFLDRARYERPEPDPGYDEDRWSVTGVVEQQELYVIVTFRENRTRIISARKATIHERVDYWQQREIYP